MKTLDYCLKKTQNFCENPLFASVFKVCSWLIMKKLRKALLTSCFLRFFISPWENLVKSSVFEAFFRVLTKKNLYKGFHGNCWKKNRNFVKPYSFVKTTLFPKCFYRLSMKTLVKTIEFL